MELEGLEEKKWTAPRIWRQIREQGMEMKRAISEAESRRSKAEREARVAKD